MKVTRGGWARSAAVSDYWSVSLQRYRSVTENFLLSCIFCAFLLVMTTGCQITQSAFTRLAGNGGAAFAAAATTLSYAHEGKVTSAYARASFVNYQDELGGLDQQLQSQQGASDAQNLQQLLKLYRAAMSAVKQPCLDSACNWQAQVTALNRASDAFLKAGG